MQLYQKKRQLERKKERKKEGEEREIADFHPRSNVEFRWRGRQRQEDVCDGVNTGADALTSLCK